MAVRGVDLGKTGKKYADHQAAKDRTRSSTFSVKGGATAYIYLCPPHENMEGVPFVERLYHQRDIPKGKTGNFSLPCMRDSFDEDPAKCPGCRKMKGFRKKKQNDGDKWDTLARKHSPRRKPVSQVIDLTSILDADGQWPEGIAIKDCFLNHGQVDGCDDCELVTACTKGISRWYMPVRAWEQFGDHFTDFGDITNPGEACPVRVRRTGSGVRDTRYATSVVVNSKFEMPADVVDRLDEGIQDLTAIDPKPEEKTDELNARFQAFFDLTDLDDDGDGGGSSGGSGDSDKVEQDEPKRQPKEKPKLSREERIRRLKAKKKAEKEAAQKAGLRDKLQSEAKAGKHDKAKK